MDEALPFSDVIVFSPSRGSKAVFGCSMQLWSSLITACTSGEPRGSKAKKIQFYKTLCTVWQYTFKFKNKYSSKLLIYKLNFKC